MIYKITQNKSYSRIILLTARADFLDKETFLEVFTQQGINIKNKELFYIERTGDKPGTIAEKKRDVILKYLKKGIYRRCRMIDDDTGNLKMFLELSQNVPEDVLKTVRDTYSLKETDVPIQFYPLYFDNAVLKNFR
jgi:hypothetical protein